MIHLGPDLTRRETEADRTARRRADAVTKMFGGTAGQSGQRLDYSKPGAPAMPTSGTGSLADLYQPAFRAEIAQRDERAARLDKLPQAVQRLSTEHGVTSIELLEVVAAVHRKSAVMGGQKAQLFASDLGRALGIPSAKADALLTEATQKGFIASFPGSYWAPHT